MVLGYEGPLSHPGSLDWGENQRDIVHHKNGDQRTLNMVVKCPRADFDIDEHFLVSGYIHSINLHSVNLFSYL